VKEINRQKSRRLGMAISRLKIGLLVLAIIFCQDISVLAQEKVPIEIVDESRDLLGKKLLNEIKDRVSKSSAVRTAKSNEQRMQLMIVTLDPVSNVPQYSGRITVASIIWVGQVKRGGEQVPYYMSNTLVATGGQNIEKTADAIIEQTEKLTGRRK
jgi:hypothetical protein